MKSSNPYLRESGVLCHFVRRPTVSKPDSQFHKAKLKPTTETLLLLAEEADYQDLDISFDPKLKTFGFSAEARNFLLSSD